MTTRILSILLFGLCAAPAPTLAVGPIRLSENRRSFVDERGRPFLFLGDTAWELGHRLTHAEAEHYFRTRRDQGFTVAMVLALPWELTTRNLQGERALLDDDPLRPNEHWFQELDWMLKRANDFNLVVALLPADDGQVQPEPSSALKVSNARAYGRWIGTRYRNFPNLIWINGGDSRVNKVEEVWRELGRGVREADPSHLMGFHIASGLSTSEVFNSDPWLDFHMLQTWDRLGTVHSRVLRDYSVTPTRPVGLGEGAYEDGPQYGFAVTPLAVRQQAWWSVLAGGYHIYGHTSVWNFGRFTKEATVPWKEALDAPGAQGITVLARFLKAHEWWNLEPAQELLVEGAGTGVTTNAAARGRDGARIVVYLATRCTVGLKLDGLAPVARASWIDPRSGARTAIGSVPASGVRKFTPPEGFEDAVLLVETSRR